ncbi:hypothetical protein TYRP_014307 [Tyrophagus putrescentiae]|nr:hypothetical protein TYRP_014307 [Tyrophagus putrescentiae]
MSSALFCRRKLEMIRLCSDSLYANRLMRLLKLPLPLPLPLPPPPPPLLAEFGQLLATTLPLSLSGGRVEEASNIEGEVGDSGGNGEVDCELCSEEHAEEEVSRSGEDVVSEGETISSNPSPSSSSSAADTLATVQFNQPI